MKLFLVMIALMLATFVIAFAFLAFFVLAATFVVFASFMVAFAFVTFVMLALVFATFVVAFAFVAFFMFALVLAAFVFLAFSFHSFCHLDVFLCHFNEVGALCLVEVVPVGESVDHHVDVSHHLRAWSLLVVALLMFVFAAFFCSFVFLFVAA